MELLRQLQDFVPCIWSVLPGHPVPRRPAIDDPETVERSSWSHDPERRTDIEAIETLRQPDGLSRIVDWLQHERAASEGLPLAASERLRICNTPSGQH
jgi:hypothetical protein